MKKVSDSLGYNYKYAILNAADYNIPQKRRRLFVVGYQKGSNADFEFPPAFKELSFQMKDFLEDNCYVGGLKFNSNGELVLSREKGSPEKNIP